MLESTMNFLATQDAEVAAAVNDEYKRQCRNLELIASENAASPAVIAAMGTVLTNKYAEGYPGRRYYGGCEFVDVAETLAIERAKTLFNAKFANVQPHSGSSANLAAYQALVKPGDTVMGMKLSEGGHLTHGAAVSFSGLNYNIVQYGVRYDNHLIDYDRIRDLAKEHQPKMLIAGASAYPRIIDFKTLADIAHEVGAYLVTDIAHIAGLVAGGGSPLAAAVRRRCYRHHAQVPARTSRRFSANQRPRYCGEARQGYFPRNARRTAYAGYRRQGGCL